MLLGEFHYACPGLILSSEGPSTGVTLHRLEDLADEKRFKLGSHLYDIGLGWPFGRAARVPPRAGPALVIPLDYLQLGVNCPGRFHRLQNRDYLPRSRADCL